MRTSSSIRLSCFMIWIHIWGQGIWCISGSHQNGLLEGISSLITSCQCRKSSFNASLLSVMPMVRGFIKNTWRIVERNDTKVIRRWNSNRCFQNEMQENQYKDIKWHWISWFKRHCLYVDNCKYRADHIIYNARVRGSWK